MRVGLIDVLDALEDDNSDELQTQLKVTTVISRKYLERKLKLLNFIIIVSMAFEIVYKLYLI